MKTLNHWFKKFAGLILAGGFSIVGLHAEPLATPADPAGRTNLMAKVSERLKLTPEQKPKVEPILQASFDQRRAVLEKYRGQRGARALRSLQKEMAPIQKETDAKLKGVLTKEQMKEFEKLRSEMKDELRDKIRARRSNSQ